MNKKTTLAIFILILAAAALFIFFLLSGAKEAEIGEDGRISGNYSLENIMAVNAPYRCAFEMAQDSTIVTGTISVNGKNALGEYRIRTEAAAEQFTSFVLFRGRDAYIWTSLYPVGYQTRAAGSAMRNATAVEQSQIVGLKDQVQYDCAPWQDADQTVFDVPEWIQFSKI